MKSSAQLALIAAFCISSGCVHGSSYRRFEDVEYGYAAERVVRSKRARIDIWVAEAGNSESSAMPLVLLHPWAGNMLIWRDIIGQLGDRRIVLLDLPGHGKSGKPPGGYPMRRLGLAVDDVMGQVGLERAVIIGNSLGGATALQLALTSPSRVAGLVVIGAPGGEQIPTFVRRSVRSATRPNHIATLSDELAMIMARVVCRSDSPTVVRLISDWVGLKGTEDWRRHASALSAILRDVVDWRPKLERIVAPVMVVQGSADIVVWPWTGRKLAARLPNGELAYIQGCGHVPQLECPKALLSSVLPFLEQFDGL